MQTNSDAALEVTACSCLKTIHYSHITLHISTIYYQMCDTTLLIKELINTFFFCILMTVRPLTNLMHEFLFYNMFIFLYMFRALLCSSLGGQNCIIQHLVSSLNLCTGRQPTSVMIPDAV